MKTEITYAQFWKECQKLKDARNIGCHIRTGQHFCNTFQWLNELEPNLFYMEDEKKASEIIKKYVV